MVHNALAQRVGDPGAVLQPLPGESAAVVIQLGRLGLDCHPGEFAIESIEYGWIMDEYGNAKLPEKVADLTMVESYVES